jgi:hypothetical protein
MNLKFFAFFIKYTNTILLLEELPLLFQKIKDKNCETYTNHKYNEYTIGTVTLPTNIGGRTTLPTNDIRFIITNSIVKTFQNPLPTQTPLKSLTNSKTGKASFYFRIEGDKPGCPSVQTFNDGNSYGPCNNGNGVKYDGNSDSKYWVAIRNANIHCGKTITINYKSNSIKLKVMDKCPSCSDGDLDMSLDALIELTGSIEAACSINTTPPIVSWNFD